MNENLKAHPDYGEGYGVGLAGGQQIKKESNEWVKGLLAGREAKQLLTKADCSIKVTFENKI